MKYILLVLAFIMLFALPVDAAKLIWRNCLIGGGDCLDGVTADTVNDGDGAFIVFDNTVSGYQEFYIYRLEDASGATEAVPTVITPNLASSGGSAYGGTKRWILLRPSFKGMEVVKESGVAGRTFYYEANSTDTDGAGQRGPASVAAGASYEGQYPNAGPTEANMVLSWAVSSGGSGTSTSPLIHAQSFVNMYKERITKTVDWNPVLLTTDGGTYINADDHDTTWQLPADPTGKRVCFGNTLYARSLIIDPNGTDRIVYTTIGGAGNTIYSSGALRDHICLIGIDTVYWKVESISGTWTITP